MTREELALLPPTIQLRLLWSVVLEGANIASLQAPVRPRPPKYDLRIARQGGVYQWASETSLEGLRFWLELTRKRASSGSKWAEKDAKRAKDLERWVAWREWEPYSIWQGERNRAAVMAAAPANKPRVYQFEQRQQPAPHEANDGGEAPSYTDDDDYDPLG